jgi:hypothetical protein
MESKDHKFKRIASKRVEVILKNLDLLSNCSNKSHYSYNVEDINKIFKTINSAVKISKSSFESKLKTKKFQL